MRKLWILLGIALLAISSGTALAQEDGIITLELPDVLVICPDETVLPSVRDAAQLVFEFQDTDDAILIPLGVVANLGDVTTVTIGRVRLTCDSTVGNFATLSPSPSIAANEPVPNPENAPGVAESQPGYLVVNTLNANLRSCDQPTCTRVGVVNSGEFLVVLGENGSTGNRQWWYVQAGDVRGWIWGDLVVGRGDLSDVPVIETQGERTAPTVYVGYNGNPIYDELSVAGNIICETLASDNYPLLGRNDDTTWVYVQATCADGRSVAGWMDARNVAIRNTGSVFVPVLNADGSPQ